MRDEQQPDVFVTRSGVQLRLKAVPPMLIDQVRGAVPFPKPPTYQVTTVAGSVEEYPHTPDTLTTDQEHAAFADYLARRQQAEAEINGRVLDLFLYRGIDLEVPDNGWAEDQAFFGVQVPDDPRARKIHYLKTEVFTTGEDLVGFTLAMMNLTGVRQEVLDAVESSFQRALQESAAA